MKFTVKCLVSSVTSSRLTEEEAVTKEVVVANPKATIKNLRATAAIMFRLNIFSFEFQWCSRGGDEDDKSNQEEAHHQVNGSSEAVGVDGTAPSTASCPADFSDETKLLVDCGLCDGDYLTLLPKGMPGAGAALFPPSSSGALEGSARDQSRPTKLARMEAADGGDEDGDSAELSHSSDDDDDDDDALEEGGEMGSQDDPSELYDRLMESVPNLVAMREMFLADPQSVLQRVQQEDPSLFQLITAHQEAFVELLNNEPLVKALQSEKDGTADDEEDLFLDIDSDEEYDEEALDEINELFADYLTQGGDPEALGGVTAVATSSAEGDDLAVEAPSAHPGRDRSRILAFEPSESDEEKIQQLTQLGFSYEQAKVAFYTSHRSLERAAHLLFESPPQL